ncbi:MAG: hypothetical protein AB7O24_20650 [Kofleriaceae bacterium]
MRSLIFVVVIVTAFAMPARAEDIATYDAEGDAQLSVPDPRVAALDEAFARAVAMALGDLVAPNVRSARKADLDREIIGRARLWVAKFTVTKDLTRDDRRQLAVNIRVDRDKMRSRLAELSIPTMSPAEASKGRSVAVLMRIARPTGTRASYGAAAEKELPGLGALSSALRAAGLTTKRAPASNLAARPDGALPLDDAEAEALAAEANVELAAIAGVTVAPPVVVRGLASQASLVTAHVRVIERRSRRVIGQGAATTAGQGDSGIDPAIDRALVAATSDVFPVSRALTAASGYQGDDQPIAEPGIVLVRLPTTTAWPWVAAEQKFLSGAKGVQRAVLRRLSPGGWVIGVTTTESPDRIAQIARRAPTPQTTVSVKLSGAIVDVAISGTP